jgi:uncharacterized protein (UPF0548 family)
MTRIGNGQECWDEAVTAVMDWQVKIRSGFTVESFIVHRAQDGEVFLTLRSLTRASDGLWRLAFPVLLAAQKYYRRRYQESLKVSG